MSLWNGVDLVSVASEGVYTEGYITATGGGNIAALMASFGLLEEAPEAAVVIETKGFSWFRRGWFSRLRKWIS